MLIVCPFLEKFPRKHERETFIEDIILHNLSVLLMLANTSTHNGITVAPQTQVQK